MKPWTEARNDNEYMKSHSKLVCIYATHQFASVESNEVINFKPVLIKLLMGSEPGCGMANGIAIIVVWGCHVALYIFGIIGLGNGMLCIPKWAMN